MSTHHAVSRYEVDKWLWEHGGTKVNGKNNQGLTALHVAAMNGNMDVVKWLVEHGGADVNEKSEWGWTALDMAKGCPPWAWRKDVVDFLMEKQGGRS